jgi:Na+:H+ antiporter, NhaA family
MAQPPRHAPASALRNLLTHEAAGGLLLIASAAVALIVANSAAAPAYFDILAIKIAGLSVLHWINDALMTLFFLMVGLEIKRELLDGQLANWPHRILPGIGAIGGMLVPALIYVAFNLSSPATIKGWGIPAATDIAFSLSVLAILGQRVPISLKVLLTALAILDDVGAIVIIALFYSGELSPLMLGGAGVAFGALVALNRLGVMRLAPYLALGIVLWLLVLKSGVHATVAGVLLALTIPLRKMPGRPDDAQSPLHRLENAIQPYVAFVVLPVFGFANAGVSFTGIGVDNLLQPVTLGCALGLFIGKQIGIFGGAWLAIRLGFASRPPGASFTQLYGVALLCGIGFTMSLFVGLLAFGDVAPIKDQTKIGVLLGSLLSAISGWLVLRFCATPPGKTPRI